MPVYRIVARRFFMARDHRIRALRIRAIALCLVLGFVMPANGDAGPHGVFVARADETDASRTNVYLRFGTQELLVESEMSGATWLQFGLRGQLDHDPLSRNHVLEVPGPFPRLIINGAYSLVAFTGETSGVAMIGSGGPHILLSGPGSTSVLLTSGATFSPGGEYLGLVSVGPMALEVAIITLAHGHPMVHRLDFGEADSIVDFSSLTLTRDSAFVALNSGTDWYVYRAPLDMPMDSMTCMAERVAGPFTEIRSFMAFSDGAGPCLDSGRVLSTCTRQS